MATKKGKRKHNAVEKARATKRPVFPAHIGGTPEEWRNKKRQEWREVMFALDRFNYGSAYVPAQAEFWRLQREAHRIAEAINAQGWNCW